MRPRVFAVACTFFAMVVVVHAQDSFETVIEGMLKAMNKTVDTLKSVKDKASADKAIPVIKEIGKSMEDLKARADKLGKPTPDQEKAMKEKYEPQMKAALGGLIAEAIRLSKEDYAKDVLKELQSFKVGGGSSKPKEKK
jgi:hypothetical protein